MLEIVSALFVAALMQPFPENRKNCVGLLYLRFYMKTTLLFFLFFALSSLLLHSQDDKTFKPYIVLGVNTSQIEGDGMKGYSKFGGNGGFGVYFKIKPNWSISTEILYNMKGASGTPRDDNGNFTPVSYAKIIMDYAEVPIFLSYHDKKVAMFGLGISLGGLARSDFSYNDNSGVGNKDPLFFDIYRKYDLSGLINITFKIKKHFGFNLRGSYSIIPISSSNNQVHNCLSVRGMYFF